MKEKPFIKQWAKREEQIERVMGATVGMYGDLQGLNLYKLEGRSRCNYVSFRAVL